MAAAYCYEGIRLRFLASLFDIQMRYLGIWDIYAFNACLLFIGDTKTGAIIARSVNAV